MRVRQHCLVLMFAISSTAALAEPGNRDYVAPWFGLGSVSSKVISQQENIAATQSAMETKLRDLALKYVTEVAELEQQKREAPLVGLPLITDSRGDYAEKIEQVNQKRDAAVRDVRTDYEKKLDALHEEIENVLASPPGKSAKERLYRAQEGTASREAVEVHNALLNLQEAVLRLNARLSADRSNYSLAATTYRAQQQLCRYVIEMNQKLRQRVDHVYVPQFKTLLQRTELAIHATQSSELPEELKQRETQNLVRVREALKQGLPKLEGHKQWAAENIKQIQSQLKIYETMERNVEIMKDAATVVAEVNADIAEVEFTVPELIEYEMVDSDFQVLPN